MKAASCGYKLPLASAKALSSTDPPLSPPILFNYMLLPLKVAVPLQKIQGRWDEAVKESTIQDTNYCMHLSSRLDNTRHLLSFRVACRHVTGAFLATTDNPMAAGIPFSEFLHFFCGCIEVFAFSRISILALEKACKGKSPYLRLSWS